MTQVFEPQKQGDFFPVERSVLDGSDGPQTVEVAPRREVRRDVLVAWGIDPSVADHAAEQQGRVRAEGRRLYDSRFFNPPLLCSCVPNGVVATRGGIVLTEEGRWLVGSLGKAHLAHRFLIVDDRGRISLDPPRRHVDEDVAVIFAEFSPKKPANYWHWTTEGLTRAVLLAPSGVPDSTKLLLPDPVRTFQLESLEAIGIPRERVMAWDGEPTRFRTVYLVNAPPRAALEPVAASISYIREHAARFREGAPVRRLWVSRRAVHRRREEFDHDQLASIAKGLGFEEVSPETMSVGEQVELFAQAEAIAGPVGAGLTNAVFMAPNTKVADVQPPDLVARGRLVTWNLAAAGRQSYAFYIGGRGLDASRLERVLSDLLAV